MSDTRREVDRLVRELLAAGYQVSRTGSGHWRVRSPEVQGQVILAYSPKKSGLKKMMCHLRKIGYDPRG